MMPDPILTAGETARAAWLVARMAKRGIAASNSPTGDVYQGDLQRKFDRLHAKAADRTAREADAMARQLHTAQRAFDDARARERTTRGDEKRAAQQ